MASVVLMKGLATFLTCFAKALNVRKPESDPHALYHKSSTAVQTTKLCLPNKYVGDSGFIQ